MDVTDLFQVLCGLRLRDQCKGPYRVGFFMIGCRGDASASFDVITCIEVGSPGIMLQMNPYRLAISKVEALAQV